MQVILFSPEKNGLEQRVVDAVTQAGLRDRTETFYTFESLSARFLQPRSRMDVVIVIAPTKDRDSNFTQLRELLMGVRVILIGSGEFCQVASLGSLLHARLALQMNDDFSIVTAVLANLRERSEREAAASKVG